jgi:DNA-directed RNA polymerase specialized sigma24 family protein
MVDWLLGQFAQPVRMAQVRYREFVAEGKSQAGPWDQLTGQIYLGTEEFVAAHQPNRVIQDIPRRQTHAQRPSLSSLFQHSRNRERMIHTAYRRHGYRLAEIASHLGVHYATISRWLRKAEQKQA